MAQIETKHGAQGEPQVRSGSWSDDPIELLKWIVSVRGEELEPWHASSSPPYERTYKCWGCEGEMVSKWPEWQKPNPKNFPHAKDCRWLALMRVVASNSQ